MKRILFVDDENKILDGIRRTLYADRKRWEMDFALGGEAALQACERGSFDVVVTDMRMPGMDGATLLAHMRDRYPGTARIILTGHCDIDAATRAIPVTHRLLAKPCTATELQSAIERACTLQEILSGAEVRRVIGSIGSLPSLSNTYACLAEAVRNPGTPMRTIADIIERDMAMSAKVLQLVNSAFFGLAQTATSLQSAVNHLGMDTIKNLVLVAETFSAFVPRRTIPGFSHESLQSHAQRTAHIVSKLPLDPKNREVTILAALLHDIGKLILASKLPDKFCEILALAKERGCQTYEAEEAVLGISHAEIGAYLLGLWGIPHLAVEAIAHHHHPTRVTHQVFDNCPALYVADLLANEPLTASAGSATALRESDQRNLETLGLLSRLDEFREACTTEAGRG
jgi:putative nucleotidyltransferase with HDIG domain